MESRARKKRPSVNNKEDRISTLSNTLLHHILSFLDNVQVVQTCVLSKRWKNLWKSHPCLDFNYATFSSIRKSYYNDMMFIFPDFINQVLVRRNNFKTVKLCFDCHHHVRHSLVESLIYYAVKHQVEEIYINNVHCHSPVVLPRCFFKCKSLRSLKLNVRGNSLALPKSLGLPSLQTLHLGGVGNFDGKIFSSCPNLEALKIEDLALHGIRNFNIDALNLKRLEILNWQYDSIMDECKVMICTPKLSNFKFDGNVPLAWSTVNLASLDNVDIDMRKDYPDYYLSFDLSQELCVNLIKMLKEFYNAKSLTLSMKTIEVLSEVPAALNEHPSTFTNLKHLKVKTDCKDVTVPAHIVNYFRKSSSLVEVCL